MPSLIKVTANKPAASEKAVRVGPGRGQTPIACLWRFWSERNEVYATRRAGGALTKISVHQSGQIHMHAGNRNKVLFSPGIAIDADWVHAIEIRFLIGDGAYVPPQSMAKLKKNDKALLIQLPADHLLILNLLIGKQAASMPIALANAGKVWETSLQDGRVAAVFIRVLAFDERNRDQLRFIRSELNPKASLPKARPTESPYMEVMQTAPSPEGNIIFIVPMGHEGFRFDEDDGVADVSDTREIPVEHPSVNVPITAPDEAIVGTLSISGVKSIVSLTKNANVVISLGTITFSIDPSRLHLGQTFERPTLRLLCFLKLDGLQIEKWTYSVDTIFDGTNLIASLKTSSMGIRNVNLVGALSNMTQDEEIQITGSETAIALSVNVNEPVISAELRFKFRLRDIQQPDSALA